VKATLVEFDLNPAVQRLKAIGGNFLRNPPAGFAENPLLQRSQVMFVFGDAMLHELPGVIARLGTDGVSSEVLSRAQAVARVPVLELEDSDRAILLTMQHLLALVTGERGQTEEELVVAGIAGARRRTISWQVHFGDDASVVVHP